MNIKKAPQSTQVQFKTYTIHNFLLQIKLKFNRLIIQLRTRLRDFVGCNWWLDVASLIKYKRKYVYSVILKDSIEMKQIKTKKNALLTLRNSNVKFDSLLFHLELISI